MGSSVSSVVGGNAAAATTSSGTQSVVSKDAFLKMLTTQLKYQDPLNPMQGTEFATQLAQFSSVEQLYNMNTTLTASVDANSLLTQSITNSLSTTLIGKSVRATGSSFAYGGSGDQKFGYNLGSAAAKVTVKVYDEKGNLVRTMKANTLSAGDNTVTWDGKDDNGATAKGGTYSFLVEARDIDNKSISSSSFTYGTISSVRFKSTGTYFTVNGKEVSLSDVLEILQGAP
jgi:flagellar basal-body rod modification protein FlgD